MSGLVFAGAAFVFSLGATASTARADTAAPNRDDVLEAIHLVENPTNSMKIGRHGELGPYQFRPTTWRMYTKKPFRLAGNDEESDVVAAKHYDWIKRGLQQEGLEPTPYRIALAWNAGLDATVRGRVSSSSRNYATRVKNLVEHMDTQKVARQ
jgi:hypothetical protein